jgi:hypothetical protein
MYFNVFIDIIIEFHHHFFIVTFLPCTPTYAFFFHSIQWLPSQHAIPLCSFFSIPVDPFQLSYNLSLFFTSIHHPTFHIPHSMSSLVARSIAKPKFYIVKIDSNRISNMGHMPSTIHTLVIFQILLFYQVTTQLLSFHIFHFFSFKNQMDKRFH